MLQTLYSVFGTADGIPADALPYFYGVACVVISVLTAVFIDVVYRIIDSLIGRFTG